ncbi:MAG: hypothetical protein WCJ09_07210 [Planctomycetota bacterium]
MSQALPQPPSSQASPAVTPVPVAKPRRRWLGRLFFLFICSLVVALWFAPMIVAETSLKQQVPKLLFPLYPGTVEIGTASLGWLQPVVVNNLKAEDAEGHPFLEVKEFSTSEPLWKLALSQANLGRLKLVEPKVFVDFRPNGSNAEDILAKMASGPPSSAPIPDFELVIQNAEITLDHKVATLTSNISPVSLLVVCKRGTPEEVELTIGHVPSKDEATLEPPKDWMAFRFGNEPTQDGVAMTPGSKHIRLKAEAWRLEKFLPALARFEPKAELAGVIDADARSQVNLADSNADWTQREWSWDGRVTLREFVLAGISALKQDRVKLATTSVAGRLAALQGRLSMDKAQIQTEVGELTATGDIPLAGLNSTSPVDALQSILGEQDYLIRGFVDLQKLAALLPNTLRVREGTEITAGRLDVSLKSEAPNGGQRNWAADATVDHLTARNRGEMVLWKEPLKLSMLAHRADGVITVDQVACQSDFFKLAGAGTMTAAKFTATGDLTRLEENLQRFVDFGLEKLAGKIKSQGEIRRIKDDQVSIAAAVQLDDFQWDVSKTIVWQEPRLVMTLQAIADTTADNTLKRIESAELKLTAGVDTLVSSLEKEIDLTAKEIAWPVKATLVGNLTTWQNRLRPFVDVKGWQVAGIAHIDTTVTVDPKQIDLTQFNGTIDNLDVQGPEWLIKETQLKFDTAGVFVLARNEWTSPQTTLTGTAVSCRVTDLILALKPDGQLERVTGEAVYRGDLDKLSRWKNLAIAHPVYHMQGNFEGHAHLIEKDSVITVDSETTVNKLVLYDYEAPSGQQPKWVAMYKEPELKLIAKGVYDLTADNLKMETAAVVTPCLSVSVHGTLAELSSAQRADLQGELTYDWDLVEERMTDALRKSVTLKGKQKRPFTIKGSLASLSTPATVPNGLPDTSTPIVPDLAGQAGIGWDSAIVEGLEVGPAEIVARIEKGVCQFAPIETTVAGGKMHLTPQVRFDRNPAIVVLPTEKVLDQVQITPQLCDSWLKYVTPMLADATQIDGKFSLDITEGSVLPISAPMTGQMAGALAVHHVQVRPGGAALQVMGMYDQIKSLIERKPVGAAPRDRVWMQMPEQAIPFKLAAGRVYHENVTFAIGEGQIQSSGSVGMDETIDYMLQIAILDDWVKDQKLLANLKGKSIRIPVRGTLTRPQIDTRILGELAAQIGGTALEGALENKVDDLFKGKLKKFLPGQN